LSEARSKSPEGREKSQTIAVLLRELRPDDLESLITLDRLHSGIEDQGSGDPRRWRKALERFLAPEPLGGEVHQGRVALGAEGRDGLVGYLLGEVRAFEFGSEPCGWVFSVGVHPELQKSGIASSLMREACHRFSKAGVHTVRTMVRRNQIPVLRFFRANEFTGGSFVQLERRLEIQETGLPESEETKEGA
jgi:ribosomal protein S18 acetylase RimI-like enzyme